MWLSFDAFVFLCGQHSKFLLNFLQNIISVLCNSCDCTTERIHNCAWFPSSVPNERRSSFISISHFEIVRLSLLILPAENWKFPQTMQVCAVWACCMLWAMCSLDGRVNEIERNEWKSMKLVDFSYLLNLLQLLQIFFFPVGRSFVRSFG